MPKALLTYQIHERQQCHDKNTELHEIIEIKLFCKLPDLGQSCFINGNAYFLLDGLMGSETNSEIGNRLMNRGDNRQNTSRR